MMMMVMRIEVMKMMMKTMMLEGAVLLPVVGTQSMPDTFFLFDHQ